MFGLDLGNLIAHLRMDDKQYAKALHNAELQLKATAQNLERIGRSMTVKVTVPLLAAAGYAAKTAIGIETAFTGVRKTVDATEEQFAVLEEGFKDMSMSIPLTVESLMSIGEAAGQLGILTPNILMFSEVMAKLGVTTNLSAQEAAMALARFANITQMSQRDFDRLGATIVDLGNNFATTEAEIVEMGLRIAAAGKIVDMTESQIMGISAALSSVGVAAQVGGTSIQKTLINMAKSVSQGDQNLKVFAKTAGKTAEEFAKLWREDAAEAFVQFIEGVGKAGDKQFEILEMLQLEDQRLTRSLLSVANAGDLLRRAVLTGNRAWEENSALTEEARKRFETAASRLRLFWNEVRLTAASFEQALIPSLLKFIDSYLRPVLKYFRDLDESTKRNVVVIGALAAALGPVLWIGGKLVGTFLTLTHAVGSFAVAIHAAMAPISALLIAIGLVVAIAYTLRAAWLQNFTVIKDRMQEWFNAFKEGFDWLMDTVVAKVVISFAQAWIDSFHYIKENFGEFISDLASTLAGTVSWLKGIKEGVVKAWEAPTFYQMIEEFKSGWKEAGNAFAQTFVDTKVKADKGIDDLKKNIKSGYKTTALYLSAFGEATVEHVADLSEVVKKQLSEDIASAIEMLKTQLRSLSTEAPLESEQFTKVKDEIDKVVKTLKQYEDYNTDFLDDIKKETDDVANAYRSIRGQMGKMTEEVYEAEMKALDALVVQYQKLGIEQQVIGTWYKEQAENLEIEFLKTSGGIANGFKAAGMQIKKEIKTWSEIAYDFTINMKDTIAQGLDDMARDFDNWKEHLLDIFEEIYYSAIRMAIIEPISGAVASGISGAISGVATGLTGGGGTQVNAATPGAGGYHQYQHGGIALSPQMAMVAEEGPEVMLPLDKMSNLLGNTGSYDIHLHNEGSEKLVVSKTEEYVLSDKRILDVTMQAMESNVKYQNAMKRATKR